MSEDGRGPSAAQWPFVLPDMPETLRIQAEAWMQEQADLIEGAQRLMTAWTRRRQEGMDAALRTFQRVWGCKNLGEAMTAYGEWLAGSMDRIIADMVSARDEALRLAMAAAKTSGNGADRTSAESLPPWPRESARAAEKTEHEVRPVTAR